LSCVAEHRRLGFVIAAVLAAVFLWLLPGEVLAAEEISEGRKIYDTIMRWVNFGILVFFFMKYGKPALMNFLSGERNRIQRDLHEIEKGLNLSKMRMQEESQKLEAIDASLEKVRGEIIQMGQREKERILEGARVNAEQMIEEAKKESGIKLEGAIQKLNDGLVEKAVTVAHEKLQEAFTDQDDETLIQGFMSRLDEVKVEEGAAP